MCGVWALPLSSSGLLFNYGFRSQNNLFCSKSLSICRQWVLVPCLVEKGLWKEQVLKYKGINNGFYCYKNLVWIRSVWREINSKHCIFVIWTDVIFQIYVSHVNSGSFKPKVLVFFKWICWAEWGNFGPMSQFT